MSALVALAVALLGFAALDEVRPMVRRAMLAEPVPSALSRPIPDPGGRAARTPVRPGHLFIPSLDVNARIVPRGSVTRKDGATQMEVSAFGVPADVYSTAWWSDGSRPGDGGMAVILGHNEAGGFGVFDRLPTIKRGAVVGVTGDGSLLRFVVSEARTGVPKSDPTALQRILSNPPPHTGLALVTCSGVVDPARRSHADNTVVFARLIDSQPLEPS